MQLYTVVNVGDSPETTQVNDQSSSVDTKQIGVLCWHYDKYYQAKQRDKTIINYESKYMQIHLWIRVVQAYGDF